MPQGGALLYMGTSGSNEVDLLSVLSTLLCKRNKSGGQETRMGRSGRIVVFLGSSIQGSHLVGYGEVVLVIRASTSIMQTRQLHMPPWVDSLT